MAYDLHFDGRFNYYRHSGRLRKHIRPPYSAFNVASKQTSQEFENIGTIARNNAPPYRLRNSTRRKYFNSRRDDKFCETLPPIDRNTGDNHNIEYIVKSCKNTDFFRDTKLPFVSKHHNNSGFLNYKMHKNSGSVNKYSEEHPLINTAKKPILPPLNGVKLNHKSRHKISPNSLFPFAEVNDSQDSGYCRSGNRNTREIWATLSQKYCHDGYYKKNVNSYDDFCQYYVSPKNESTRNQFSTCLYTEDRDPRMFGHRDCEIHTSNDDDPFLDRSKIPGLQPRQSTNKRIEDWLLANEKARDKAKTRRSEINDLKMFSS